MYIWGGASNAYYNDLYRFDLGALPYLDRDLLSLLLLLLLTVSLIRHANVGSNSVSS